jgi:hypothetical protein
MPKYLVESISQYRMVYCIQTDDQKTAISVVESGDAEEFGQQWLGETIVSMREVNDSEALRLFDELNDYLVSWTDDQKLQRIHVVDTKQESQ